jgi:hypothetical protein
MDIPVFDFIFTMVVPNHSDMILIGILSLGGETLCMPVNEGRLETFP